MSGRGTTTHVSARLLILLFAVFSSAFLVSGLIGSGHAQTTESSFVYPPGALPSSPSGTSLGSSIPAAKYDEQLWTTFTQSFSSIAYNVTAVAQSDSYGYGPGYLLNGLTPSGYWYQVGLSYDWPRATGGFRSGFNMNYEVFDASGNSIFPSSGYGGIASFSGSVSAGDLVLLDLYFSSGNVTMYAKDWNTGASAFENYSSNGASTFQGLNAYANSNGFFTGLMTEEYHVSPFYGSEQLVTYNDSTFALTSGYMAIDEFNISNLSWTGGFGGGSGLVQYTSDPTHLQSFSSNGATEASDAYEFLTGSAATTTTSIRLLAAGQSTSISSSNEFSISYVFDGAQSTSYDGSGVVTLNTDAGTTVSIAGTSTGSTSTEKWVLDSQAAAVSFASGSNVTYCYYDILAQPASYSVLGGGTPSGPTLTYFGAPQTASGNFSESVNSPTLPQSFYQIIWPVKGSTVSVSDPILGTPSERWSTQTASWVVTQPDQIPSPIPYHEQFLLDITGAQLSSTWFNSGSTAVVRVPGVYGRVSGSGERVTSYSIDGATPSVVQPTTGSITVSVLMDAAHQLAISSVAQYQVSLDASATQALASITPPTISADKYWYDEGTPVNLVLNGVWGRSSGTGERLASYSVNGNSTSESTNKQVVALSLPALSSPQVVTALVVTQYELGLSGGSNIVLSRPSPTNDSFFDNGTSLTVTTDYTWKLVNGDTRQNLLSYTLDGDTTNVTRAGSGSFTTPTITFDNAHTLAFNPVTQYLVSFELKDSSGADMITPTSFQIEVNGTIVVSLPKSQVWLDSGTRFLISSLMWEGMDVKPANQNASTVVAPLNDVVRARVYDAKLQATDYLGIPISGAQVTFVLANGTTVKAATGGDGTISLHLIPIGTFNASIAYLGTTANVAGDASTQPVVTGRLFASYPTFGLIGGIVIVAVLAGLFLPRRSRH